MEAIGHNCFGEKDVKELEGELKDFYCVCSPLSKGCSSKKRLLKELEDSEGRPLKGDKNGKVNRILHCHWTFPGKEARCCSFLF